METGNEEQILSGIIQEMRRGTITLAVLSQLREPQYGYSLIAHMSEKGFVIEANTLYPLLRRLEKQGLLESLWDTDGSKPRKFYKMSPTGADVYGKLCRAWSEVNQSVWQLIEGEEV